MTRKYAEYVEPDETPAPKKARERELTAEPTKGGVFTEEGSCLQPGGLPEPDEHRMKKPER